MSAETPLFLRLSKWTIFLLSVAITATFVAAHYYLDSSKRASAATLDLIHVGPDVYLTSQLRPDSMRALVDRGLRTVVDIRPDGEDPGQPPSQVIEAAAKRQNLAFHYIPVPHESVPDEAVDALGKVLTSGAAPAVLYCRTGRRAARLFALAVASQADGPGMDAILNMVQSAGFTAEDLKEQIEQRIARRTHPPAIKNP